MEKPNLANANKKGGNRSKMPKVVYEDVEFSNQELQSSTNMGEIPSCGSMDSIFDELLRDSYDCTHFHTCNPPGPELFPHTHKCVHVHTKKPVSSGHDDSDESKQERGGNREAVRKYRQKKKAYTKSLADELVKLKAVNQELTLKLYNRATLEAEVARLKCLLVDIRGRIEGEIGSFPYQKVGTNVDMYHNINYQNLPSSSNIPCNNTSCGDQIGLQDGTIGDGVALNNVQDCNACGYENLNCMASLGSQPSLN